MAGYKQIINIDLSNRDVYAVDVHPSPTVGINCIKSIEKITKNNYINHLTGNSGWFILQNSDANISIFNTIKSLTNRERIIFNFHKTKIFMKEYEYNCFIYKHKKGWQTLRNRRTFQYYFSGCGKDSELDGKDLIVVAIDRIKLDD
jgi:hypothetical protein